MIKDEIIELQKKIDELKGNQEEKIKFLAKELFKEMDASYDIEYKGSGMKSIDINWYKHLENELHIKNMLNDVEIIAKLD